MHKYNIMINKHTKYDYYYAKYKCKQFDKYYVINGIQFDKYKCKICERRFSLSFLTEISKIPQKDGDLICQICRHKINDKIIKYKPEVTDSEHKNCESENAETPKQKVAVKCYKANCTNYIQTNYNDNQIQHCNVTCITCNIDSNGENVNKIKYEWICPRNDCNGVGLH